MVPHPKNNLKATNRKKLKIQEISKNSKIRKKYAKIQENDEEDHSWHGGTEATRQFPGRTKKTNL